MRIILVDDDYLTIDLLKQTLDFESFNGELVGCANNGTDALKLVENENPDIVISDIKMPDMDGIELSKQIFENHPNCYTILISGHSEFEYAQKAVKYQVCDYILKPITRQKILELNNKLQEIYHQISSNDNSYSYLSNDELRDDILNNLRKGDIESIGELFVSDKFLSALSKNNDETLGIQLLNYLFIYQQEFENGHYFMNKSKEEIVSEYRKLTNVNSRLAYLSTYYYDLLEYAKSKKNEYKNPIFENCTKILQENYKDPYFNISYLADMLNLSLPYISTIFKEISGQNISRYLSSLRLEHAKILLKDISISIKDVCLRSGYEDPHYFTKFFKKQTGMTPSEYRNLYNNSSLNSLDTK